MMTAEEFTAAILRIHEAANAAWDDPEVRALLLIRMERMRRERQWWRRLARWVRSVYP